MEDKSYPKRKYIRLKNYDYSTAGCYFITICTANRKHILSTVPKEDISRAIDNLLYAEKENALPPHRQSADMDNLPPVGAPIGRPFTPILTEIGKIVQRGIEAIPTYYPTVQIDDYVIMPNHLHILLTIDGQPMAAPTIGRLINQFKGSISKLIGKKLWQKSFYEHIVRDANDYYEKRKYVYENPMRWSFDELYQKE